MARSFAAIGGREQHKFASAPGGRSKLSSCLCCPGDVGGGLRAKLRSEKIILISHPARNQKCIDEDPNDRDQHPNDRERQDELRDRDPSAFEIKIVTPNSPKKNHSM